MDEPDTWTEPDRAAVFSQLFRAHHRRLVGLASVFVDDHEGAEDVVRDAFLTLHRRRRLLGDRSAAVAHLDERVVDGARKHLRHERRPTGAAVLVPTAFGLRESDATWLAICALPRKQREVVVLRFFLALTDEEVARRIGTTPGSVETYASRALAGLGGVAVAEALVDHADQAMARTDTESELREVLRLGAERSRDRRRQWAVGGLVAAALVASGTVAWPTAQGDHTPGPDSPTRTTRPMNADEKVAHDFVSAYFAFDRRLAASYLVHGVTPALRRDLGERGWLRQNRLEQALGSELRVDGCFQIATLSPGGARVGCLYTVNTLGLGEVGYGPFSGNLFAVTVLDGKVADFFTAIGANDYEEEAWGPFQSWIEDTHPRDVPALRALDDRTSTPLEVTRSIRAWRRIAREYADALQSGAAP